MRKMIAFLIAVVIIILVIVFVIWWHASNDPIVVEPVDVIETYVFEASEDNRVFHIMIPEDAQFHIEGKPDDIKVSKAGAHDFYLPRNQEFTISIQRHSNAVLYRPKETPTTK